MRKTKIGRVQQLGQRCIGGNERAGPGEPEDEDLPGPWERIECLADDLDRLLIRSPAANEGGQFLPTCRLVEASERHMAGVGMRELH